MKPADRMGRTVADTILDSMELWLPVAVIAGLWCIANWMEKP